MLVDLYIYQYEKGLFLNGALEAEKSTNCYWSFIYLTM